jgi:hypothetical protein
MTDLPLTIIAELRAANGKCSANFSGPNASEFQFWRAGDRMLAQLLPMRQNDQNQLYSLPYHSRLFGLIDLDCSRCPVAMQHFITHV